MPEPPKQVSSLYMTTLPRADSRAKLSTVVDEAEKTHQRVEVTKNGRPATMLMSADDCDPLTEPLDVRSWAETMVAIREAAADTAAGRLHSVSLWGSNSVPQRYQFDSGVNNTHAGTSVLVGPLRFKSVTQKCCFRRVVCAARHALTGQARRHLLQSP